MISIYQDCNSSGSGPTLSKTFKAVSILSLLSACMTELTYSKKSWSSSKSSLVAKISSPLAKRIKNKMQMSFSIILNIYSIETNTLHKHLYIDKAFFLFWKLWNEKSNMIYTNLCVSGLFRAAWRANLDWKSVWSILIILFKYGWIRASSNEEFYLKRKRQLWLVFLRESQSP